MNNLLLWPVIIYFMCGIARDWMGTRFYVEVSRGRRLSASMLSSLLTLLDMTVIVMVITSRHPVMALSYALGCGVGVFFAVGKK